MSQQEIEGKSHPGFINGIVPMGTDLIGTHQIGEDLIGEYKIDENPTDLTSDKYRPRPKIKNAPPGAVGVMIMDLLLTEMPYEDVLKTIQETYPGAKALDQTMSLFQKMLESRDKETRRISRPFPVSRKV